MDPRSPAFAFFSLSGVLQKPNQPTIHQRDEQADPEGFAQQPRPGSVTGAMSLFTTSLRAEMSSKNGPLIMLFEAGPMRNYLSIL